MRTKMRIQQLNEMSELRSGERISYEPELCKVIDPTKLSNVKWITARSNGHDLDTGFEIFVWDNRTFYRETKSGKIVSILNAPRTKIIQKHFPAPVAHEEAIDTCEEYKRKGLTANFYYSIIKSKLSILSDYKHYTGTQFLWKSLAKKKGVIIQIYKSHELIETNYDLIVDPLKVWSTNEYLILATMDNLVKLLEEPLFRKIYEEEMNKCE
jgi:hypothetical protein